MRCLTCLSVAVGAALVAPVAASAHGDRVPVDQLASAWRFEAAPIAVALLALALFARAFVRLRRRGRADHANWHHATLFGAGVLVALLALVSPLDAIGEEYLLVAHMGQHQLLLDLSPALVMLGLRGPLGAFLIPPRVLRPLARNGAVRAAFRFLTRWQVALVAFVGSIAAWHVPGAYEAALEHQWLHDLEHLSFAFAGALLWLQIIDPGRRNELSRVGRVYLGLTVLAAVHLVVHPILLTGGVRYGVYAHQDERLLGLSATADQHWAAVLMTVEELLVLGTAILVLAWPLLLRLTSALPPSASRDPE